MKQINPGRQGRFSAVWAKSLPGVNPRLMDACVVFGNCVITQFKAETLIEAQQAMKNARESARQYNISRQMPNFYLP